MVDRAGRRLASVTEAGGGRQFSATERFDQRRTGVWKTSTAGPIHVTMDFSANRCVVDVDTELGLVKVVQMDVARTSAVWVNPIAAHGQVAGGSVMGMVWP